MTEIRINQNLCRLCGCKNENGQTLSSENGAELLLKVQETFSMLISGNDPLPRNICIQCEQDVNVFYMKIKRFRTLDKKWRDEVQKSQPNHSYLNLHQIYVDEMDQLRKQIDDTLAKEVEQSSNEYQPIQTDPLADDHSVDVSINRDEATHTPDFDLKQLERDKDRLKRLKRKRFMGYVRSRKLKKKIKGSKGSGEQVINPISIDAMNTAIPKMEVPYKKYRNEIYEIVSQNSILEHRTRVNRRTSQPFDYRTIANPENRSATPKNKLNKSLPIAVKRERLNDKSMGKSKMVPENSDTDTSNTGHGRNRRRINYSEELVDEAFMYEQILQDKQHQQEKRKRSLTKSVQQKSPASTSSSMGSGNLDSRLRLLEQRNEISITPVKSRSSTSKEKSSGKMPVPIKQEPHFNLTSSVSVHIKSRKNEAASSIQISNIASLHDNHGIPPKKRRKCHCEYCGETFSDENSLVIHQSIHMQISMYKIDSKQILHPKLRRGRMLNLENEQYIRCVNCWKLHSNNKSILDHWNNGACFFYCAVCGKSYHDNIKELETHYESEHSVAMSKVQQCLVPSAEPPKEPAKKPTVVTKETKTTSTEVKTVHATSDATSEQRTISPDENVCTVCERVFGSRKALNTHYTLKHGKTKKSTAKCDNDAKKMKVPVNPFALANEKSKMSKNQKSNNKKWNHSTNEAVMKTVIRKVKPLKKRLPTTTKSSTKSKAPTDQPNELTVQSKNKTSSSAIRQTVQELEISQDQTVSSTYLTAINSSANEDDLVIKPEPIEEYSNSFVEAPAQNCNGWTNVTAQYDDWNYDDVNTVDSYIDTSPRLKVKDLTGLQDELQPYQTESSVAYAPNPLQYKQQSVIVSNQNLSGFQIQNVQSYQVHPVQTISAAPPPPPPLQPQPQLHLQMQHQQQQLQLQQQQQQQLLQQQQQQQQQHIQQQQQQRHQQYHQQQQQHRLHQPPQQHNHHHQPQQQQQQQQQLMPRQPYVEYTMNTMNSMNPIDSNMNLNEHGMCSTNNLYEMHHQPPVVQSTQPINPVFLLPTNSTHTVPGYHY